MTLLQSIQQTFGPDALEPPLFYRHSPALRFELAGGETRVAQFLQAINRARAILEAAFAGAQHVTLVLIVFGDESTEELWQPLRESLCAVGLSAPAQPPEHCRLPFDETKQVQFALELPVSNIPEVLWSLFLPELAARVNFAAPELGLLACPYDDRGMDITGPNTERLARLYHQFNAWLLDYDRARMAEMFSASTDSISQGQ